MIAAGLNHLAHRLYTERVERLVHRSGLYAPLYGVYQRLVGAAYRGDRYRLDLDGVPPLSFHAEHDAELVSLLHTVASERDVLQQWAAVLEPDDVVWDVGANLGVYSAVSAAVADRVIGFEPHPATAARARENLVLNNLSDIGVVHEVALGRERGSAALAVDRHEIGTQTPRVDRPSRGSIPVEVHRGEDLDAPAPDAIKIDVEGQEPEVLTGLGSLAAAARVVLVERHADVRDLGIGGDVIASDGQREFVLVARE